MVKSTNCGTTKVYFCSQSCDCNLRSRIPQILKLRFMMRFDLSLKMTSRSLLLQSTPVTIDTSLHYLSETLMYKNSYWNIRRYWHIRKSFWNIYSFHLQYFRLSSYSVLLVIYFSDKENKLPKLPKKQKKLFFRIKRNGLTIITGI